MLWLTLVFAMLVAPAAEVYVDRSFGSDSLPAFDKGRLIFINHSGGITLYGRDGKLVYDVTVTTPKGGAAGVMSAAIDTDGAVVAAVGYAGAPHGYGGGLAFVDPAGKQMRFVETDRYMPANICFAPDHTIWSFGWQRDLVRNELQDSEDHFVFRRYSRNGAETGQFVPRSSFPPGLSPGSGRGGLWKIRAASDRIGALAFPNSQGRQPEWIELDLRGNLIGRWKLPARLDGGLAFTASGGLYTRLLPEARWAVLERNTAVWKPLDVDVPPGERPGLLLGAEGDDLVFAVASPGNIRLRWWRPPQ